MESEDGWKRQKSLDEEEIEGYETTGKRLQSERRRGLLEAKDRSLGSKNKGVQRAKIEDRERVQKIGEKFWDRDSGERKSVSTQT